MASPTKDSSPITNPQQQEQGQGHDHGGDGDVGNNPIVGFGSSSSPDPPTDQENETADQTPTSTEVEPSQTPPASSPTLPIITSSGGVCEITSHAMDLPPPPPFIPPAASNVVASSGRKKGWPPSGDDVGNNPIVGFGSPSSPDLPTDQANETADQTPTSTEVKPSETPPVSSPTLPIITSFGGVCEITSHAMDLPPPSFIPPAASNVVVSSERKRGQPPSGDGNVGNNPIVGFGLSSSPDPPIDQANETADQTPTSTEVEPSKTPPVSSPTLPLITSSGGVFEITSHAMDLPPPPFIPPAASNVVASSGRKRGWPPSGDGDGESSSMPRKALRGDYTCIVCGREFPTDKSYYGHLRKHPERVWRGAYPPQVLGREVKKLGPTLLELANQTSARILSGRGPSSTSYSLSGGSLCIDLNNPPPPPISADDRAPLPFDLNMPPPIENDEEEEEDPDNIGGSSAQ